MVLKDMTLGATSSSYVTLEDEDKEESVHKEESKQHSQSQHSRDLKQLNDPAWKSFCEGPL